MLLLLPQRYIFSSKSQLVSRMMLLTISCCCYHKGTYFQANHNEAQTHKAEEEVVVATTKVHIFKQITTYCETFNLVNTLLLLPQRYIFSSKSQQRDYPDYKVECCCCYHKGTYFQANHNLGLRY